jgi:Pyruvate/2-oxoacid:ferredoxin oxidoreductase gamma subunit
VPLTALARQHVGTPIAAGVASLGCVAALTGAVSLEALRQSVGTNVPRRMVDRNLAALEAGYAATESALKGVAHV